ncbi:MAG: DUF401 family protein [Thermoplasmata archaeon]
MDSLTWLGFALSVLVILAISRWHLGVSLLTASLVLAVFTLSPSEFGSAGLEAYTDPGILLLALAVATIPMIGGYMERSGALDSLVRNMHMGRKAFLAGMPALLGMLPMPGGALLSAPIIKRGGEGVSDESKVCLNVWFRHVIYLIYPLSTSLIVSAYVAGIVVYDVVPYLLPFLFLAIIVGTIFFLGEAKGRVGGDGAVSRRGLLVPLSVILTAPIIDFVVMFTLNPEPREASLLFAILVSLSLAVWVSHAGPRSMKSIARRMKPWNYGLIILGMFLYLAVFNISGVPELIGGLDMPLIVLCIGAGAFLGIVTGRMEVPASIVIPIYLGSAGLTAMAPAVFAVTYASIFVGYIISPVHPCVSISLEYFGVSLKKYLTKMAWPSIILMIAMIIAGMIVF